MQAVCCLLIVVGVHVAMRLGRRLVVPGSAPVKRATLAKAELSTPLSTSWTTSNFHTQLQSPTTPPK
jgi:hypothetical protein